ncbi:TetR/AcrR family transcriptional regulator [Streptomyces silvensis]|uniref:TetR family transcriptional regulator n=1 Tax=Streptomyces silvensis TaxID=1765722 RepID=A0A0W7WSE2_9ACTN|nr:TetR/AcrR family transcriptional regulator [Streptomyces silvensis]KUF13501.1 TetR family transcriptional regulator [Streptomyces silvensis]
MPDSPGTPGPHATGHRPATAATALRRTPVQRRSAERLTRILDACAALLDEVGYEDLTTRAVAERAGVPIGSVYRFFGNKRAMADALAHRNLERYAERVTRRLAAARTANWRTALDAVLDEYVAMKRTAPGFTLVDFGTQIPVGDPGAAPNHRVAEHLARLLAPYLGHLDRTPGPELNRTFLVAVETADALFRLAFRIDPAGDDAIIAEAGVVLRAYLAGAFD